MSNDQVTRYQVSDQEEAVAASARQLAREKEAAAAKRDGIKIKTEEMTRVNFRGGEMFTETGGTTRVQISSTDPNLIKVGGMETTREAAAAVGLVADDDDINPKAVGSTPGQSKDQQQQVPDTAADKIAWMQKNSDPEMVTRFFEMIEEGSVAESQEAMDKLEEAYSEAHGPQSQSKQSQSKDGVKYASAEERVADGILQAADKQFGAEAVNQILDQVVASDNLDNLAEILPEGISVEQANKAMAGYVAWANRTLEPIGITGAAFSAVLSAHDLQTVRRATLNQDTQAVIAWGKEAKERLSRMPDSEPEAFMELAAEAWPNLKIKRDENNTLTIPTSNGRMAVGVALYMGLLKL